MVLLSRALQQLTHKASTVAIGRAYELLSIEVLRLQSFQLTHRGRPGDKGIDFWGTWVLPSLELAVAGQCKCLKTPLRSAHVREFEGTVGALRRSSRGQWLGVLVSRKGWVMHAQTITYCAVEWVCGKNRLLPLSLQLVFACTYVIEFNNTFLICNYCTCSVSALQWLRGCTLLLQLCAPFLSPFPPRSADSQFQLSRRSGCPYCQCWPAILSPIPQLRRVASTLWKS